MPSAFVNRLLFPCSIVIAYSCYESVPGSMDEVRRRVEEFMGRFNENSRSLKMELVLFKGEWAGRRMARFGGRACR